MNEIPYVETMTSMTKDIEGRLAVIKREETLRFQTELNRIINSTISDVESNINYLNRNLKQNLQEEQNNDKLINDFNFKVRNRVLTATNELEAAERKFDNSVREKIYLETNKLNTFIQNNSKSIQQELQEALYQINKSENHGVRHLEETYDLGVETIVSAEKTALANLKKLVQELSTQLNISVEQVEAIINEKLANAQKSIKELENNAISNLNKASIQTQRDLENIKNQFVAEVKGVIDNFQLTLDNYSNKLKQDLTAHKDSLLKDITLEKELIFIELDREKNNIIGAFNVEKDKIIKLINDKCQVVLDKLDKAEKDIANLTEQRYVAVLEPNQTLIQLPSNYILNNRVKVYIDGIMHFPEGFFEVKIAEKQIILNNSYNYPTNIAVICDLPDHNIEALKQQLYVEGNHFKTQILNDIQTAGREEVKVVDGIVQQGITQVQNKVDQSLNTIVGTAATQLNEYITNLTEQKYVHTLPAKETLVQLPQTFVISNRMRIHANGDLLIPDLDYIVKQREKQVVLTKPFDVEAKLFITDDLPDNNIEGLKQDLYNEGNRFKEEVLTSFRTQSEVHKTDIQNKANQCVNSIVSESTNKIDKYITNLVEQKYSTVLTAGKNVIDLPPEFVLYQRTRVYIDGKLAIPDSHYTIDLANKKIILTNPVPFDSQVLVTDDYPSNDITELKKVLFEELRLEKNKAISSIREQSIAELQELNRYNNDLMNQSKTEINTYVTNYKEGSYSMVLDANKTLIEIPRNLVVISMFAKVFIDGILQLLNINYTIDDTNNTISLLTPFEHPVNVTIFDNIDTKSMNDTLKRPATDAEINALFNKKV